MRRSVNAGDTVMDMMAIPLSAAQVSAANAIRGHLEFDRIAMAAFDRLASYMPGFAPADTLIKVAAVNQIYGTNLYAVSRMAAHISRLFASRKRPSGAALVEAIAGLPAAPGTASRRHLSFASKFCNRFIDREEYPIIDTLANWTLRRHLGADARRDEARPYAAFLENRNLLIATARLRCSAVELDTYLWIRGGYESWKRGKPMNGELRSLFQKRTASARVRTMLGD
jgi:hypothetical protein